MTPASGDRPFGVLAEFEQVEQLVEAARHTYAAGYRQFECYSPLPIEGLPEAMGVGATGIPLLTLVGGLLGAAAGYGLQFWVSVDAYPVNIGGRPLHSWPLFIPVTFECTILVAALFAVLGMLALNGLPRPYHPLFDVPEFSRATQDRFFICILARDPKFEPVHVHQVLSDVHPVKVTDVSW